MDGGVPEEGIERFEGLAATEQSSGQAHWTMSKIVSSIPLACSPGYGVVNCCIWGRQTGMP
ncbi:unnamed protein product [Rhodiola kirilowii]